MAGKAYPFCSRAMNILVLSYFVVAGIAERILRFKRFYIFFGNIQLVARSAESFPAFQMKRIFLEIRRINTEFFREIRPVKYSYFF